MSIDRKTTTMAALLVVGGFVAGLPIVPLSGALAADAAAMGTGKEWPFITGDWNNSRYSTLSQINRANIDRLSGAWVSEKFEDAVSSRSTPVVHDGLMFVTAGAYVYALDAKNGKRVWTWKSNAAETVDVANPLGLLRAGMSGLGLPAPSGVTVGQGLVYVGLMDAHVAALKEKTGQLVWIKQTGNTPPTPGQGVTTGVTVVADKVFAPLGVGEFGMNGRVVALDSKKGQERWKFFAVPLPGTPGSETWSQDNDLWKLGGVGIWQPGAVDRELGLIFYGTGNPIPIYAGQLRAGDNSYSVSIIALEMKTGKLRWHYQLTHHDIWEGDIAVPVVLFDRRIGGQVQKAIAAMRGDGYLFMLDRATGKPLDAIEERPVPQDAWQKTARTQPFPVDADTVLGDDAYWQSMIPKGFVYQRFSPPSPDRPNVLQPSNGVRVQPMAYSPQTQLFYVQGLRSLVWLRRLNDDPWFQPVREGGHVPSEPALDLPGVKDSGVFAAIDSRTNKIVWRKEFTPDKLGGGPLVTAGGLVFRGSGDGNFEAYDATTGDPLWHFQTGNPGSRGPASTYEVEGEQYIAFASGPVVVAFKLDGPLTPRAPAVAKSNSAVVTGETSVVGRTSEATHDIEVATVRTARGLRGRRAAMDEYAFSPTYALVSVGRRVRFINNGALSHTIVADSGQWTTGRIDSGLDAYVTFDTPGSYPYHCKEHPWARGSISAEKATSGTADTAGTRVPLSPAGQLERGQVQYQEKCASCHGDTLAGYDRIPSLAGRAFLTRWNGRKASELFENVKATMPQNAPQSLSDQDYIDIIAYILKFNKVAIARGTLDAATAPEVTITPE